MGSLLTVIRTCVISVLRLQAIYVASESHDVTWDGAMGAIWSSLEVNTCIICSCLPILKGCISQYFPRIFSSIRGTGHTHSRNLSIWKIGNPDSTVGIDMDHLARSKANTAVCDGPRGRWDGNERASSRYGSHSDKDIDGIQVVRVVEQDTMDTRGYNGERSDSESTRKLVRGWV